jgi:hypothetical protein
MDVSGSDTCPVAGFDVNVVETSGSVARRHNIPVLLPGKWLASCCSIFDHEIFEFGIISKYNE